MYFLIKDDNLVEKPNIIWYRVSADIKEEFACEPIYNKKILKIKIKSHGNEVTDFYNKGMAKTDSSRNQLGFCPQKDENYYLQVFLKL